MGLLQARPEIARIAGRWHIRPFQRAMHILVIEDNSQVRAMLSMQLACIAGVSLVRSAVDGRAGLEAIGESAPDLLLLDLRLPQINGFGVLEALRIAGAQFPVIAMSASGEYRARSLTQGASYFFDKNSETECIFATVARMAAERGARPQ
ncbi:MAG: response regulator [Gemmatimonadaceae bacterium]